MFEILQFDVIPMFLGAFTAATVWLWGVNAIEFHRARNEDR
jgi:hypothetical protein